MNTSPITTTARPAQGPKVVMPLDLAVDAQQAAARVMTAYDRNHDSVLQIASESSRLGGTKFSGGVALYTHDVTRLLAEANTNHDLSVDLDELTRAFERYVDPASGVVAGTHERTQEIGW